VRSAALAADHGWPGHAIRLSAVLSGYLEATSHFRVGITIGGCARRAARLTADRAAEAAALISLGSLYRRQDRYEKAADQLRQALVLCKETADEALTVRARDDLAALEPRPGRHKQA
jgi:hypothetical protein